ncbi:MAG: DUF721 domain-containing protein [Bacteroidota bacterium]|nr:DUF721 domain-containing protein [Bacteroidota bacterium]
MSKDNEQTLGDVLKEFRDQKHLKDKLIRSQIEKLWFELYGDLVQNHTDSIKVKENKLLVKLNSSVLRHELNLQKSAILKQINEHLIDAKILDIEIR